MRKGRPSATAEMVCSWRALEHTLPPDQRILDDPYARGFLGPVRGGLVDGASALPAPARRLLLRRLDQALQGVVTFVLARHRAIDDLILTTDSDQVVFLGAGYDTRPARLCARLCESLVFEVDHPDTDPRRAGLLGSAQRQVLDATMGWIYSEPFLWHCSQDQIAGFFSSCGLAVLEDLGLDELIGCYAKRDTGWWEAAPSLRLVVAEPF